VYVEIRWESNLKAEGASKGEKRLQRAFGHSTPHLAAMGVPWPPDGGFLRVCACAIGSALASIFVCAQNLVQSNFMAVKAGKKCPQLSFECRNYFLMSRNFFSMCRNFSRVTATFGSVSQQGRLRPDRLRLLPPVPAMDIGRYNSRF